MKQLGWEVTGFDLSDQTDRSVQAAGIEVFTGSLEDLPVRCSGYDAISMWHVLEHLHDPVAGLRLARGRLAPGGRQYVEVPNSGSAAASVLGVHWHQWDLPRHLSHFTPESLARLFRLAGLRLCRSIPIRKTAVPQALRSWTVAPGGPCRLKQLLRRPAFEHLARIAGVPLSMLGPGENIFAEATIQA
jgi:hypothetical protein